MFADPEADIFEYAVSADHPYRQLHKQINFNKIIKRLKKRHSDHGNTNYTIEQSFKMLLLQFWEDASDREMERAMRENLAFKWFCGFGLKQKTPDHSFFGRFRSKFDPELIAWLFNQVNKQLHKKGLYGDTFTFMDASKVISKVSLWQERDRAIADGYEKLDNQTLGTGRYTSDKDARWGAKSKKDIWYGYKRHCGVDMRHGMISKTTITPANVMDSNPEVIDQICPEQGAIFADKLYDTKRVHQQLRQRGCYPAIIRKRNNPRKDTDQDRWRSQIRMPYESTFSRLPQYARYRGIEKLKFQNYMQCLVYNLKKAVKLLSTSPPRCTDVVSLGQQTQQTRAIYT